MVDRRLWCRLSGLLLLARCLGVCPATDADLRLDGVSSPLPERVLTILPWNYQDVGVWRPGLRLVIVNTS